MILSVQERYSPESVCFGCGPKNPKGLSLKSFIEGDRLVASWRPSEEHQAFPGMLNGGICGALLDCHSNWTAAMKLMETRNADKPPCTVTADFHVKLLHPTPIDEALELLAWVVSLSQSRAQIDAQLIAKGRVTATCRGNFVAVREGHPAFNRW